MDAKIWKRAEELAAENAAVFHTAFRHMGNSPHASAAHKAIDEMNGDEWLGIVTYGLYWIAKAQLEREAASEV